MTLLVIYGATGYTGRLVSEHAKAIGLNFMVAGRSERKLQILASRLEVPYRVFDLDQSTIIDSVLQDAFVILNCAGPFVQTAKIVIEACLRTSTHYLDISAEIESYQQAKSLDQDAKSAGVMILPGCGGSVAMLGCLASHVVDQVKNPISIDVALHVAGSMSRGSAISAGNVKAGCLQLVDGCLVKQDTNKTIDCDFDDGNGVVTSFPVTLPDLLTISHSSNVANVRAFAHASSDGFPTGDCNLLPEGPTEAERDVTPYHAVAVVASDEGYVKRAVLHTLNGYTFTCFASIEAAKLVLENKISPGFQTPVMNFGKDFLQGMPDTEIVDFESVSINLL
ncbi:NAD(P)-binding protein [Penicillium brevicompactum]|uniref:NAD(P)-binding protein n=1 Tax=Penicillium brevicompactum TaxID=5074 RepID=A0A9W9QY12_PENBR|nr:NAD(P)-binding protein [Penicillium brevicompactum]